MKIQLNDKEVTRAKEFRLKHQKKHGTKYIGVSYISTGNEIGIVVEIRCNKCNEIENITDYGCW